jgi:hypothetical protein
MCGSEEKRISTIDIFECEKSSRRKGIIESRWVLNVLSINKKRFKRGS